MRFTLSVSLLLFLIFPPQLPAFSWEKVGREYNLPPQLLYAIARVESNLNPNARSKKNQNGSYDIGLMQINSTWLPVLKRYGISESDLYHPLVNLRVGAWILAQNIQRYGPTWRAVGAYNAVSPSRQLEYVQRIASILQQENLTLGPKDESRDSETALGSVEDCDG